MSPKITIASGERVIEVEITDPSVLKEVAVVLATRSFAFASTGLRDPLTENQKREISSIAQAFKNAFISEKK
jgi:hypothetical protein